MSDLDDEGIGGEKKSIKFFFKRSESQNGHEQVKSQKILWF